MKPTSASEASGNRPKPAMEGLAAPADVLLVEDNAALGRVLAQQLALAEVQAEIASSGREALEKLSRHSYKVIVLDLRLPDMDGLEVCRRLRSQGINIPLLIISGYGGYDTREAALRAGANDYLLKPFRREEFVPRVQAFIASHRP